MRAETLFALIFLVLGATFSGLAFQYGAAARFGPLLIGTVVVILVLMQLLRENLAKSRLQHKTARPFAVSVKAGLPILELGAWASSLLVLVYLFGIVIGLSLFLFAYLRRQGETWKLSILLAVGAVTFIYGVFGTLLHVYLYKGLIFG